MIDYQKIASAIDHYKRCGYIYLDAPWLASLESINITCPPDRDSFRVSGNSSKTPYGQLVASGEQSFLEIRQSLNEGGKYVCCTPCFRAEPRLDEQHQRYFMKVELIEVIPSVMLFDPHLLAPDGRRLMLSVSQLTSYAQPMVNRMINEAFTFFMRYVPVETISTTESNAVCTFDLQYRGIEVGSYGLRWIGDFIWVYGTGCAEPRLSIAEAAWKSEEMERAIGQRRRFERSERGGLEVRGKKAARGHKKA